MEHGAIIIAVLGILLIIASGVLLWCYISMKKAKLAAQQLSQAKVIHQENASFKKEQQEANKKDVKAIKT